MPVPPVPAARLRWACPAKYLPFATTQDLDPAPGVVGQESAAAALRFGIRIHAEGHNVFVRGPNGTGRRSLVLGLLTEEAPTSPPPQDLVFVYRFSDPNQPRLLVLPPGDGPDLRGWGNEIVRFVGEDLSDHVNTDSLRARVRQIESRAGQQMAAVSGPFETSLAEAGLALVGTGGGEGATPAIVPVVEGQPVPFEAMPDPAAAEALREKAGEKMVAFQDVSARIMRLRKDSQRAIRSLVEEEARRVLEDYLGDIHERFPAAQIWIAEVIADICEHLGHFEQAPLLLERYRVRVLRTCTEGEPRPVVVENAPTVQRLLGGVDVGREGPVAVAPHLGIHSGALMEASGGTLVLDAQELLQEPGAWPALKRTLRSRSLELTPMETSASTLRAQHLRPQSIPIDVKVVLLGEPGIWMALDQQDPDFSTLFKVLVDLDELVNRDKAGVHLYAQVVARLIQGEALLPFTSSAVGALVEHGARVASQAGRLTARFGRIADLVREGDFIARERGSEEVDEVDIQAAIRGGKERADLPGRRFRERIVSGMIHVQTQGAEVGQVNGLAVISAGPLTYGFPMRITASVGAGSEGAIHLQREAMLSGQIHTKGFLTLRGLLREFLAVEHPLLFDASITHEQSYGGVDGDSASGAEFVCLVSALTALPVRQGFAMTSAVDQHGNMLPVGAVDEKIEGWFDTCAAGKLDGTQGVVVPAIGVRDLQLRRDVVEACIDGRFAVFAIERIEQALELFLEHDADGIREKAAARVAALWKAGGAS